MEHWICRAKLLVGAIHKAGTVGLAGGVEEAEEYRGALAKGLAGELLETADCQQAGLRLMPINILFQSSAAQAVAVEQILAAVAVAAVAEAEVHY